MTDVGTSREVLSHTRTDAFSRNSGTIVSQLNISSIEANTTLFDIQTESSNASLSIDDNRDLVFVYGDQSILFVAPEDNAIQFAVV